MKFFTKEVKIALVAITGVVLLFFGMNFLKGLNLFSSSTDYYVEFEDISGLSSSSPVYVGGYQVGTVKSIIYDYTNRTPTKVVICVDKEMRIPQGSQAKIVSDMLGNVKINLDINGKSSQMVPPGGVIKGGIDNGAMGQLSAMIPAIEKMLPKLDSIMGSLNTLLADPAIAASLHNVQDITSNLNTSTRELNTLMRTLNRNMPGMMAKADGILNNTDTLTAKLAAIDIDRTMTEVNATLANVRSLTDKLNSNKGTLGLLMNDPSLYNNLNSTMMHADSLVVNLREHPKRYVHFSIFGRKDK